MAALPRLWEQRLSDPALEQRLAHEAGVSPRVARLLAQRGMNDAALVIGYFKPHRGKIEKEDLLDPFLIRDMDKAVTRILQAIEKREPITVYGDYDADGVCSTVMLTDFLRRLGGNVDFYIPNRLESGYGLNETAVRGIHKKGTQLLITADCGISGHAEIAVANELKLDTIVIDHHHIPDTIPSAFAVLNPLQPGDNFPFKSLCATGISLYLVAAVVKQLRAVPLAGADEKITIREYLDIFALGTIADMVPLNGVNRMLVQEGLKELTHGKRPGIVALKEKCHVSPETPVLSSTVGFRLAPKLNAAGRMGDAALAAHLLLEQSHEKAAVLADQLLKINDRRKEVGQQMTTEAEGQVNAMDAGALPPALVLYNKDWHLGLAGLVANKLLEQFGRPAVILTAAGDFIKGSARAPAGFHVAEMFEQSQHLLKAHGGHAAAGGLTLVPENLEEFKKLFLQLCEEKARNLKSPPLVYDDEIFNAADLSSEFLKCLAELEPFGMGNAEPCFLARNVPLEKQEMRGKTLKLTLGGDWSRFSGIAYNTVRLEKTAAVDLIFTPEENFWRNQRSWQLRIHDVHVSNPVPVPEILSAEVSPAAASIRAADLVRPPKAPATGSRTAKAAAKQP